MSKASLGQLELEVLNHISDREPVSVREVADEFLQTHGLARTTILTIMDRLRGKGYLNRKKSKGLFMYRTRQEKSQVHLGQVKDFVQKNLGGYVSPFFAYLASGDVELDKADLSEMKRLIAKYEKAQGEGE